MYVCDASGNIVVFEVGVGKAPVARQTFHVNNGAGIRSIQFVSTAHTASPHRNLVAPKG